MRFNKIMLSFGICIPLCIALRFFQIFTSLEAKSGFYIQGKEKAGLFLLCLPLALTLAVFVLSCFIRRRPKTPPKGTALLNIFSFLTGIGIFCNVIFETPSIQITNWQSILLKILGSIAAGFFIFFALSKLFNFNLPPIIYTVPTLYMIIRMICDFTTISKLALISDNIFLITTYCLLLLFFLNFSKLYNGLDRHKNPFKLLSFGLSSSILCFTTSIPNLTVYLLNNKSYLHTPLSTNIALLFMGLFVSAFIISHFSINNLSDK